jgi:hypothetical protein
MPLRQTPNHSPEQKDFKETQLGRTKERIGMLLKNPNLSQQKKERLVSLLQKMDARKTEIKKETLSRINRKIESITGRDRITMMKESISSNYDQIKNGNLSSFPKLFSLLRSDRVPLKFKDLALYRLNNKLFMKDETGSYTFDLKANANKNWEVWYKGKKLTQNPRKIQRLALEGLIEGKDTKESMQAERERNFRYTEQPVSEVKSVLVARAMKERMKNLTQKPEKKIIEDIHKFSETTATSAGPLPESLINYAKGLNKETAIIRGNYKRENGQPLEYAVYIRSKVVGGKKVFEFDIHTFDKYAVKKVRTRIQRYWPSTNEGQVASYFKKETGSQVAMKEDFKSKVSPTATATTTTPERVAAKSKEDETMRLVKKAAGMSKEIKKQPLTADKYREGLQKEVSKVLNGLKNPRNLYNRLIEERYDELNSMNRAEKSKVYQEVARTVSKFITTMQNFAKELNKGQYKTIADMNQRFKNALSILPANSRQREVYAGRLDRVKTSASQA